ncbi:MAG TPA: helix-turn-helix domain-containing protein [Saprospiraceae bacterium]|nr:helix-turn-helix domain-containing protein [Saprospiraceae bacterium]
MTFTLVPYSEVEAGLKKILDEHYERVQFAIKYGTLPEMLTTAKAAELLGLDQRTIRSMALANELRFSKKGRMILICKDDVLKFLTEAHGKQIVESKRRAKV